MIECNLWPMNILTKPVGSKDRALIVHPKPAVDRAVIRRNEKGKLYITDESGINIKDGIYIPEMKEVGHRHFYCKDSEEIYHVYGRRLNVKLTYTDIFPKIVKMPHPDIPPKTVIDCEIIWPGHHDSEVTTAIKECPEELRMRCFALPIYNGVTLIKDNSEDYWHGRERLEKLVGIENCTKRWKPISIPGLTGFESKKKILEALLNLAEANHQEGYVLKQMACDGWYKLKGINEADVFITGFKISDAETRKGMVTGVEIGVMDEVGVVKDMGHVAGFNLTEMNYMTDAYNKHGNDIHNPYMAKVLRVIYQEVAGQGKMKHGFFDCWRTDKRASSCSIDQFKGE